MLSKLKYSILKHNKENYSNTAKICFNVIVECNYVIDHSFHVIVYYYIHYTDNF